jgi:hypothetical protein
LPREFASTPDQGTRVDWLVAEVARLQKPKRGLCPATQGFYHKGHQGHQEAEMIFHHRGSRENKDATKKLFATSASFCSTPNPTNPGKGGDLKVKIIHLKIGWLAFRVIEGLAATIDMAEVV